MTITTKKENEKITLTLKGRLDMSSSQQLHDVLISCIDDAKQVVMDFAEIAYISSAGLRVLLLGQKTANVKHVSLSLCHVQKEVKEVFDMTGFNNVLTIE